MGSYFLDTSAIIKRYVNIIESFRRDARKQYNMVRVIPTIYTRAGELCRVHRLRAYDAMQLACALKTRATLATLGIVPTFVTADINLLNIAQAEGLGIENPNSYA